MTAAPWDQRIIDAALAKCSRMPREVVDRPLGVSRHRSWNIHGDCSDEQAIHSVNELLEAEANAGSEA